MMILKPFAVIGIRCMGRRLLRFSSDISGQQPPNGRTQYSQQLSGRFLNVVPVSCNLAA